MVNIRSSIKNEFFSHKRYVGIGYLISFLTVLPQIYFSPPLSTSKHIIFMYITLFLLLFALKFNRVFFVALVAYINITNIIIGHVYFHWGYNGKLLSMFSIFIESPSSETMEYLTNFIGYKDIALTIYVLFVFFLLTLFLKKLKNCFKILKYFSIILFALISFSIYLYKNPLKSVEPFSIPSEYMEAKTFIQYPIDRVNYLKSLSQEHKEKNLKYNKIVFIQGESVNKHYMSLYGYHKKTTPFFDSLKSSQNFYVFNAISPANLTRVSVPIINTKATVDNYFDLFMKSRSIVGNFGLYNYKTYWISSQAKSGLYDSVNYSMSKEADVQYFTNSEYSKGAIKTDFELVKYLKSIKDINATSHQMFFFHLIGSHFSYNKRYTKDVMLIKNPKNTIDHYNNTIFYTDYIIKSIFNYFKETKDNKVLYIYISDHGEFVSDNNSHGGHGRINPYKEEYEVPFVIYSTIKNSRIDELYRKNKDRYFNLENLNYLIEYIVGIRDDVNISYSSKVIASDPENILNYNKLKSFIK